jgi:Bor protein
MSARVCIVVCVLFCAGTGCYRTVYRNFEPPGDTSAARLGARRSPAWRHFFLYGWVPHEVVVHAAAECGGAANVREIRTRRTFGQGLVASFATTGGVNVYSPWIGEVICSQRASGESW